MSLELRERALWRQNCAYQPEGKRTVCCGHPGFAGHTDDKALGKEQSGKAELSSEQHGHHWQCGHSLQELGGQEPEWSGLREGTQTVNDPEEAAVM